MATKPPIQTTNWEADSAASGGLIRGAHPNNSQVLAVGSFEATTAKNAYFGTEEGRQVRGRTWGWLVFCWGRGSRKEEGGGA